MNLYVHIPFCLSKCGYCALYSEAISRESIPKDLASFYSAELALRLPQSVPSSVETLYYGGGTPSMLGADGIAAIADGLRKSAVAMAPGAEWTVECNPAPELSSAAFFDALAHLGVNRVSFGVQSFNDEALLCAGRRHTAADAALAVHRARDAGFANIGIDLIAGLPGDDPIKWRDTLEAALALDVAHVSVYSLIVEPRTRFAAEEERGDFSPCEDAEMLDRLALAESMLSAAGFRRYEISNYARPGFECRHNLACWRGEDYLGLGPGASSRHGLFRRTNARDWHSWRDAFAARLLPPAESEEALSPQDDAEERFIFGLRMAEGVSPDLFAASHPAAASLAGHWRNALAALVDCGIAREISPGRWALSPRGREVADSAIETLLK